MFEMSVTIAFKLVGQVSQRHLSVVLQNVWSLC